MHEYTRYLIPDTLMKLISDTLGEIDIGYTGWNWLWIHRHMKFWNWDTLWNTDIEVDGRERRDTFSRNSVSRGKYNVSRCNLDKICNYWNYQCVE